MKTVAPGVQRLDQFPLPIMNVYLAEDVLFDSASSWDRRRLAGQLKDVPLSMLALTHVHPDHQGLAHAICSARDIPLACHADDVDAMEGRIEVTNGLVMNPVVKRLQNSWQGPPHEVSNILNEGDEVLDFKVIHAPGHAPGEVIYWRESDRTAICGDVIRNINFITGLPQLAEPPVEFTYDPALNRQGIRRLAELNPLAILPGHGAEVTDMAKFESFVDALPSD